jgi:tetratricopeptide (TPR) repeat protein
VRTAGPAHPATLRVLVLLADAAARGGDRDAARNLSARLEGQRLPRRGERDEAELCEAFDAVARLLEDGGEPAAGDQLRTALLDDRRRQFGARHPHVASTLVHLAAARQGAGAHRDAIPLFREQNAILRDTVGPMHPDVATALLLLAESQRETKDFVGAEESLAEALSLWEQTVGPEHPVTRETLQALATVRLAAGKRAEALPLLEQLVSAFDDDPAADRAEVLSLVIRLAEVHQNGGDQDRARQMLRRAQDMELAGGGGPDHVSMLAAIARLQRLLGDDFAAAANLSRARALAERSPDPATTMARLEAVAATGLAASPP